MAKRVVAIGGVPCSGKTTLVREILNNVEDEPKFFKYGLLRGYISDNVAIIGIYKSNDKKIMRSFYK